MKDRIYVDGKLLGEVKKVTLKSSEPSYLPSDFNGPFTATADVYVPEATGEVKKIIEELKKEAEMQEKLEKLLKELSELVPTIVIVGLTKDKRGAMFMGSPEKTDEKRKIDVVASVAIMLDQKTEFREVIFSAVSWYMQDNPKYQDAMREALEKMKNMSPNNEDGHQRTAEC